MTKDIQMQLETISPRPELSPFIGKMWVFRNSKRLPDESMKLIVPNGMTKIIIPVLNGLIGKYENWCHHSKETSLTLVGIADSPAIVDIENDAPHINIGIELTPAGAYRILSVRHAELKNKILPLEDILGKEARIISDRIASTADISMKISIIQSYLVNLLSRSEPDLILEYCLRSIANSKGLVTVTDLEGKTGYSSRWLYEKFMEKVGLSPKSLSSVTRFLQFYEASASNPTTTFFKDEMYNYFYDQAHFIKEFRRFTGMSPTKFIKNDNEFGHIFYRG